MFVALNQLWGRSVWAAMDRFNVKELYQTASGGKEWFSKWDDGASRTFTGADPRDLWFDANHGNATYNVDGKGLIKISGPTPRMYIHDPMQEQSWRNVEMTVYAMRIADAGTSWGGIEGVARTNHGTTGRETENLCDTRGIDARMRYDGHIDFEKETSHPNSEAVLNRTLWPEGLPKNVWIGYKLVVYDLPDGNVKLELWLDETDGLQGGNWRKVNELIDTGNNFGIGGVPCKTGIDPALKLTNSDNRQGSESGKPNTTVYWRSDNVGTNGLIYKRMSVRDISLAPIQENRVILFKDDFDYADELIADGFGANATNVWKVTSGSLYKSQGGGWTGVPNPANGSAVFRMTTDRKDFGDVEVSFKLLNQGLSAGRKTPATEWDGCHVWLRYQDQYNLYAASINRRDNKVIIKKKDPGGISNGGTYYNLTPLISHPVPYNQWQNVKATVSNNKDGSVTIKLYAEGQLLVSVIDDGSVGGPPITTAGAVGIRGDNANLKFSNFTVRAMPASDKN